MDKVFGLFKYGNAALVHVGEPSWTASPPACCLKCKGKTTAKSNVTRQHRRGMGTLNGHDDGCESMEELCTSSEGVASSSGTKNGAREEG